MRNRGGDGIGVAPGDAAGGRWHFTTRGDAGCDVARAVVAAREGVRPQARGSAGYERGRWPIALARGRRVCRATSVVREAAGLKLRFQSACGLRENRANLAPLPMRVNACAEAFAIAHANARADAAAHPHAQLDAPDARSRRACPPPRAAALAVHRRAADFAAAHIRAAEVAHAPADADAAAHPAVPAGRQRRQTSLRAACVTLENCAMAAQLP